MPQSAILGGSICAIRSQAGSRALPEKFPIASALEIPSNIADFRQPCHDLKSFELESLELWKVLHQHLAFLSYSGGKSPKTFQPANQSSRRGTTALAPVDDDTGLEPSHYRWIETVSASHSASQERTAVSERSNSRTLGTTLSSRRWWWGNCHTN